MITNSNQNGSKKMKMRLEKSAAITTEDDSMSSSTERWPAGECQPGQLEAYAELAKAYAEWSKARAVLKFRIAQAEAGQ